MSLNTLEDLQIKGPAWATNQTQYPAATASRRKIDPLLFENFALPLSEARRIPTVIVEPFVPTN